MSRDEFEELLYYVVELKDKLNNKLDEQCAKINHQASIVNQQGQIIDELCWQLREMSEKTRELRVANRALKTRLDGLCPRCSECRCDEDAGSTYQNHVAERYNEMVTEEATGVKKNRGVVKSNGQGQEQPAEVQAKVDEYSQVNKASKKKWLFGGGSVDRKEPIPEEVKPTSGNTTWYLEVESIYEPIELSAKPTTAARLEQISAEVSNLVPKPAPRRLYAARAMDNLAQYFGEGSNRDTFTVVEDLDDAGVMLRPSKIKQFSSESQRGSSKVACSQISDLEQSYLPSAEYLTTDDVVRFTINSRPATAVLPVTNTDPVPDRRRHAIRSFM